MTTGASKLQETLLLLSCKRPLMLRGPFLEQFLLFLEPVDGKIKAISYGLCKLKIINIYA